MKPDFFSFFFRKKERRIYAIPSADPTLKWRPQNLSGLRRALGLQEHLGFKTSALASLILVMLVLLFGKATFNRKKEWLKENPGTKASGTSGVQDECSCLTYSNHAIIVVW